MAGGAVVAGAVAWVAIRSLGSDPRPPSRPTTRADPQSLPQVARGETLYAQHCSSCHGSNLEGQAGWNRRQVKGRFLAPPHDESGHTWHHPDTWLFDTSKHGESAPATDGSGSAMPAFRDKLVDDDIWAVLAFIKSRWPAEIRDRQARAHH